MTRCKHCGASLVAPEEFGAHADGACAKLIVPPPPNLGARIRMARAKREGLLEAEALARPRRAQRGSAKNRRTKTDDQLREFEEQRNSALSLNAATRAFLADTDETWHAGPDDERRRKVNAFLARRRKRKHHSR